MPYPALHELMGTYLHQDYDVIGTVEDNVEQFTRDFADLAPKLPSEVDRLLMSVTKESELRDAIERMGCQIRPLGGTYRAWLQQIADRVRAATQAPGS